MALRIELAAPPYHLDKLSAAELKVNVLVVAENKRIICIRMLKRLVNIALKNSCTNFCAMSACR